MGNYFDDFYGYGQTQESYDANRRREANVDERGTTMDILHDLWVGTGQAVNLLGEGLGVDKISEAGKYISETGFAKPDTSQYYGTQGRIGRVVDGIAQSLPVTVAIGGTAVAGGLLAGPGGAATGLTGAMGILGKGTFEMAMDEVKASKPDLPPEEQFKYATTVALSEVGTEALGQLIPFGIGKALSKPAQKALLSSLLDSGRVTTKEAVGAIVKNAGGLNVVKGLFGGAVADGTSEIANELISASARDAAGLEENPVDLIDIFLIGSAPGGLIAGGTMALDAKSKAMAKKSLETGLQSEDVNTRLGTVDYISKGLSKIDPEIGGVFKESILQQAINGPVDLEGTMDLSRKEEVKSSVSDEIINKSGEILQSKGIPLGEAELSDRADLEYTPEVFDETRVLDEGAYYESPEYTNEDVVKGSVANYMKTVEPDTDLLSRFDAATGKTVPATIAEASVPLYDALILDNARSQAIKEGMQRVLVDSNKLAEITNLDEREVLQKRIEKTQKQIAKEVSAHTKEAPKKVQKVAPAIKPIAPKAPVVAPVAKVEPKAPTVLAPVVKPVEVTPEASKVEPVVTTGAVRTVPEGKAYKEQLLVTQKLEEDLARAQATAKTGKPEEATAAKELASILAEDVQVSRKRLQSMPKPAAEPIVFKSKKEAQEATRLGAPEKMGESDVTIALGLQDQGVDVTPAVRLILGKQKKLSKQELEDPVKVKEAVESVAKVLKTPQQIKATGIGKGRTVEFHDGTKLISMGETLELPKRWLIKQGTLMKRVPSEKAGRTAIAEGTVKDLKDYADEGRKDVLAKDMPKLTKEQKVEVEKFIRTEKYEAYGAPGDVALAASLLAADGKLYEDGKLNVKGLRTKTKSITDTITRKSSESMSAGQAGVTSGVTEKLELSTEEDIVLPAEKKAKTKEEVAAERKAKKESLEASVVKVEATEDLKAQILARHKEAMAKRKASGATLESELGAAGAKRVKAKQEMQEATLEEEEGDHALYDVSDRLSWKKNREPQLTDEFISTVIDGYLAPAKYNSLEAILNFSKEYPNPRTQALIDTQMFLVSSLMAEKTVMKNYFSNNYKNASELLDGVIAHGTPEAKALAEFIRESPKVKELENIPVSVSDSVSFFTARDGGAISIRSNGMMDVNVWLHEIQHAATSREILSNEKMRDEVKVMMRNLENNSGLSKDQLKAVSAAKGSSSKFNEIAKQYSAFTDAQMNIAYSLVNEREFLAQLYSSSAVRDLARRTRHTAGSFKDSIWKRIKQFFSDIMRLPKEYDSVLEAALRVSEKLYNVNYKTGLEFTDMSLESRREETLDEAVRKVIAEKKPEGVLKTKIAEKSAQALTAFKKLAQPISDTLKGLSDPIYAKLMLMEANQNIKSKEYSDGVQPFLKYYKGLTESQRVRLDIGLLNRNKEVWEEMPKDVRVSLETVLDDGAERSIAVGYLMKKKDLYFPRRVKDIEGLVKYLTEGMEENGPLALALKAKADSVGMQVSELPQAMRNQVVSDMLASGEIMQLPKPGSAKKRSIGKVTSDLVPFYENSSDALLAHIYELNDKVSLKEFVGSSGRKQKIKELISLNTKIDKETDEGKRTLLLQKWEEDAKVLANLEEELSGGIQELIDKELSKAPTEVQTEVFQLLSARLRQKGASGIFDTMRNVGYMVTMGNYLSAITQLGDIPIIFYRYGITLDNVKAIGDAFKAVISIAKGEITGKDAVVDAFVKDLEFTNALREFSSGSKISSKALETVFKYSGLKYMDLIGKETAMNASYRFYQNPKNKQKFIDKFENFFEKPEEVLQKIQMGNRKDKDVLTAIFAELSDFQPISLSQQSEVYLKGGNARMFFALKTFTLRTTSAAITEGMLEMRKGGALHTANGVKKIAAIILLYALAGAGADELKDLLKGKTSSVTDNVTDNMLQMMFLSKFTLEKGMQKDQVIQGILEGLLPPVRYMDNFVADVSAIFMEDKEQKYKTASLIPLVGTIIQARSTPQQASYAEQDRKKILEEVKANAKGRKGAYHGSITDKVREYNKNVPSDKRLKSSDIMSAYKRE